MNERAPVFTMMTVVGCLIGSITSAQSPSQGSRVARDAFPVSSTVRVVRDVVYAEYGHRQLKLDVYLPPGSSERSSAPGILVVRGGGWQSGDKEAFGFIAGHLAEEGFVAASIEYRTSAEAKFPAAVHDVKAAVRWLRAHAATYGVSSNAIGAIGGSAGGHLVAMLATSSGVEALEGAGGDSTTSSEVQAVVAMACVCNLELKGFAVAQFIGEPLDAHADTIKAASPVTYVNNRSAPLLLLHSQTDPVVPFKQSLEIESLYRAVGASAILRVIEAPNTHAFWNETRYFPETISQAVAFFRTRLKRAD